MRAFGHALTCCVPSPPHDDAVVQQVPVEQLALLDLTEGESWRRVREAPLYEVSSEGRVRRGEFEVASWANAKGYHLVNLEIAGVPRLRYVHRLILAAFRGVDQHQPIANHRSGVKSENTLDNLEWTTSAGNAQHARALGLVPERPSRTTCRFGHPRDQAYAQHGRRYQRCARCRRVASRRKVAAMQGLRSLLALLD